jgi:hypothetical protein
MAAGDVSFKLLLEQLMAIWAENARTHERLGRIEARLCVLHTHVGGLVQSDLLRGGDLASLSFRVERIERRLDLHDSNI